MKQRLTLTKSFLRGSIMYSPGQLVPADVTAQEMKMLIANGAIVAPPEPIEIPEEITAPETPVNPPQFDFDPNDLKDLDKGQLQVMLANMGFDPVNLSEEDMRTQLSGSFQGKLDPKPETTGTKLDEAIKKNQAK